MMKRSNKEEIVQAAREQGMTTMMEDGFKKASEGYTSITEILRVVHD